MNGVLVANVLYYSDRLYTTYTHFDFVTIFKLCISSFFYPSTVTWLIFLLLSGACTVCGSSLPPDGPLTVPHVVSSCSRFCYLDLLTCYNLRGLDCRSQLRLTVILRSNACSSHQFFDSQIACCWDSQGTAPKSELGFQFPVPAFKLSHTTPLACRFTNSDPCNRVLGTAELGASLIMFYGSTTLEQDFSSCFRLCWSFSSNRNVSHLLDFEVDTISYSQLCSACCIMSLCTSDCSSLSSNWDSASSDRIHRTNTTQRHHGLIQDITCIHRVYLAIKVDEPCPDGTHLACKCVDVCVYDVYDLQNSCITFAFKLCDCSKAHNTYVCAYFHGAQYDTVFYTGGVLFTYL